MVSCGLARESTTLRCGLASHFYHSPYHKVNRSCTNERLLFDRCFNHTRHISKKLSEQIENMETAVSE